MQILFVSSRKKNVSSLKIFSPQSRFAPNVWLVYFFKEKAVYSSANNCSIVYNNFKNVRLET